MLLNVTFWGTGSEWFWAFTQFVVIIISIRLIWSQLRVQAASHVVQSLSTIHSRWNSETMIRVRYQVCSDWKSGVREFDGVPQYLAEFMEELGVYLRIRAIAPRELWEAHSWYIEHYFSMLRPGINHMRKDLNDPNIYSQFELLFNQMQEQSKMLKSNVGLKSERELDAFVRYELAVAEAFVQLKYRPAIVVSA